MKLRQARNDILAVIKDIEPCDTLERDHIDDTMAWIESGANIYRIEKPDKPPKHLVSYFVVVDPDHGSLLLADHIKAQLWLPSGGHVELGEHPRDTVVREMREELNQEAVFLGNRDRPFFVTVTKTVGLTAGHTDVSLWYLVRGSRHNPITFDRREFKNVEWFTFDEILEADPSIFDPHMQRFTKKLIAYLGRRAYR